MPSCTMKTIPSRCLVLLKKAGARGLERCMCTHELYNMGITSTKEEVELVLGGKGWFPLFSGWEELVLGGFVWEGLVSGGFGSFRFLVTTLFHEWLSIYSRLCHIPF